MDNAATSGWIERRSGEIHRTGRTGRLWSVDVARGLIMVLMALDHTRMYFSEAQFDPLAVGETDLAYFLTRWVTHLCAPGFFFLAGLSVWLAERRNRSSRSPWLLAARGAWLAILEFTLIGFAWSFNPGWSWFGVIWSLGASMILLAALRRWPRTLLAVIFGGFLLVHNALPMAELIPYPPLYELLYGAGAAAGRWVIFPVLPWLSIMVIGYVAGPWLMPDEKASPSRFALAGTGSLIAFILLRAAGIGEPPNGAAQRFPDFAETFMSFLDVEKYPPSTQYVLVTLALLLLATAAFAALERRAWIVRFLEPLRLFGSVPLFFYILHIYLIHGLALLGAAIWGWPSAWLFWQANPDLTPPDGYGLGLAGVYATWVAICALLLPLCMVFARLKARSGGAWLKFL